MSHQTKVVDTPAGDGWLRLPGIKLTVLEGPDRGKEVVARRGVVRIGSAEDNDLVLRDSAVSRRHLEVRLRGTDAFVRDLGSTNGTQVYGVRVVEALLSAASLIRVGDSAIRATPVEDPVNVPLSNRDHFGRLLGKSQALRQAFAILERAAPSEATVLITGETGTGKELAAEGIHGHSPRSDGPFVAIDCGAIAASLMESELFGHVRGAFTGAVGDRKGVFEEANGGTVFLDEIGELPLELQPKLLRVLENREVRRVGASQPRPVDVRVVAATNRDLATEVNRGTFREDLYFRLAVVEVSLPPLRARLDDIPLLVRHFVERFAPGSPPPSADLVKAMAARPWPGNVRELRNAVERALAMAGAPDPTRSAPVTAPASDLEQKRQALHAMPIKEAVELWTEDFERSYLEHVLRLSGGSVSGAARLAQVNRRYIQRMMKRHGVRDAAGEDE
ncbi:MAG: sigma 54-interacting transcriptional regulator [Myxococcota bacterium]